MKSHITNEFRELYNGLDKAIRNKADEAYDLFRADQFHTSLKFKEVNSAYRIWSVRVSRGYRALGVRDPKDEIVWYWIGDHDEYERVLKQPPPPRLIR